MTEDTRLRVFLVDDHSVLRQSLRVLIDMCPDMTVVGESVRGRSICEEIRQSGADVVVLDVSMPDIPGPMAAAEIREALPMVKIVALTRHGENAYVRQMMQAGATGYVLKQTAAETLMTAIRIVGGGGIFVDPAVAVRVREDRRGVRHDHSAATSILTEREREIVTMVAYGHTNKEIAAALGITVKTVEAHKSNLMHKLDITSRAELVRFALAQGWMQSE